jgi:protein phosphatase
VSQTPQLQLRAGAATHVGRVRQHNEDHAVVDGTVFVVADGMGGHAAGEVASELAADTLAELAGRPEVTREDVVHQLELANTRIVQAAAANPGQRGMGTTVTGLVLATTGGSDHWLVFNIGDSRVYRFAAGQLSQVTIDHTEIQELLDGGLITQAEVATHPSRHVVTRSLGFEPMPTTDTWVLPTDPGERFVLCSDGVFGELSDAQMEDVLRRHPSAQEAADVLVQQAVEAGGRDNATVVVVGLEERHSGSEIDPDTAPRSHTQGDPDD